MTGAKQADPVDFLAGLKRGGAALATGVPCSSMTGLMNAMLADPALDFANAPNEGEALAFAAGARLGGRTAAVLCQNSGLSNLSNALTSLIAPYRIPVLLVIGWRGRPGVHDEPQHRLVGGLTEPFLKACGVAVHIADADNAAGLAEVCARTVADGGASQAILVPMKLFCDVDVTAITDLRRYAGEILRDEAGPSPPRDAALQAILDVIPDDALIVAPTGLASRALFRLGDAPSRFYMMGSMGHAPALGLGIAAATDRRVIVLDGDGSMLMRLSGLAFVGARAPGNLLHIVLDNGIHESTGGQMSLSPRTDLCAIAAACGYRASAEAHSTETLTRVTRELLRKPGPAFIRVFTSAERAKAPPRIPIDAAEIAARFSGAIANGRTQKVALTARH